MTDAVQDRRLALAGDEDEDRLRELALLSESFDCHLRGISDRDDGSAAILFAFERGSYAVYFTTGYFPNLDRAVDFSVLLFSNISEDEIMSNLLKNNKLFPNIRGVMLKEKRVELHLSGKTNIVEMRDGGDARCEIYFDDHPKTAVINRNQLLDIIDVHGPETSDWEGMPVVLYAEQGKWFGKVQWGIRVDREATERATKKMVREFEKKLDEYRDNEIDDVDEDAVTEANDVAGDGRTADMRASLEETDKPKVGDVIEAVHALSNIDPGALLARVPEYSEWPEGKKATPGVTLSKAGAVALFDWLAGVTLFDAANEEE